MTGGRGLLFDEGPSACPFIALDRDRQRRADEPDSRHRCYATPAPEPRALAHQRSYCLTANFGSCPIFQDWAVRAAARPVPLRPVPPALAQAEAARPVGEAELSAADEPVGQAPAEPQQASLFDAPPLRDSTPPMPTFRLTAPTDDGAGGQTPPPPIIPPPVRPQPPVAAAPAEPLLREPATTDRPPTGRPGRPARPDRTPTPTLSREDIVPPWERAHYDLPDAPSARPRGGTSRLTLVLTALAVVALIAVVILMVPVLFHSPAAPTQQPTASPPAGSPSAAPSPSTTPAPAATWLTYTIKLGDNLYHIAAVFNITYDQLLAANPQITNPDYIRAGDVINIPPPDFVVPTPTVGPSAASPSASP
jgi:LysM repeat protein